MKSYVTALASLGLATAVLAGPAFADTQYLLTEGPNFTSGDLIGSINYSGTPTVTYNNNVYIGPLNMDVTNETTLVTTTQTVYCTDIFDEFKAGGLYTLSATSLTSYLTSQLGNSANATIKVQQINALLSNAAPTNQVTGAAIQAAIWEIENETGVTGYSLANGLFTASVDAGNQTAFAADATSYLSNVSGTNGTNGTWQPTGADSVWEYVVAQGQNSNQTFGFLATTGGGNNVPLPEPTTLTVLGLGLAGLVVARRRKA